MEDDGKPYIANSKRAFRRHLTVRHGLDFNSTTNCMVVLSPDELEARLAIIRRGQRHVTPSGAEDSGPSSTVGESSTRTMRVRLKPPPGVEQPIVVTSSEASALGVGETACSDLPASCKLPAMSEGVLRGATARTELSTPSSGYPPPLNFGRCDDFAPRPVDYDSSPDSTCELNTGENSSIDWEAMDNWGFSTEGDFT